METITLSDLYGNLIKLEDWVFYKSIHHEDDSITWEPLF